MFQRFSRTPYLVAAQSFALGLCFLFLETLKAMRSSQWGGIDPGAWAGLVMGLVIYTGVSMALTGSAAWLLGHVKFFLQHRHDRVSLSSMLAGGTAWLFLSAFREETPTPDDVLVLAGVLGLALWPRLIPRLSGRSPMEALGLLLVALLAGHTALHACGYYYLYAPERAMRITLLPPVWAAVVLLTGLVFWTLRRRSFSRFVHAAAGVFLPLLAAWAIIHAPAPAPQEGQPNLVLIVSDSLRADYLSAYGGQVTTPHLEALAKRGALFEQSYSMAPWTLPSMTALFSSQYPPGLTPGADAGTWQAQLYQYGAKHPGENLAERLKAEGYTTAAFTSNAFLPSVPGMLDGFDDHATSHPILLLRQGPFAFLPFLQDAFAGLFPAFDPVRPHDTTLDMTRYVEAFLARNRDKPFFLWVHYIDPHAPYAPPPRFKQARGRWPFFYPYKGGEAWGIPVLGDPDWAIPPEDRAFVQYLYEGEVRYIDEAVGHLTDRLRRLGLAGNTVVCFTADHGEELWDHGRWGHGQSLHDELLRVPLILSGLGIEPARITPPVSAIDLMPTLADLVGIPPSPGWRGVSLVPDLRTGGNGPDRPVFAQGTSDKARPNPYQMVRRGRYKLIRQAGSGALALYDMESDPREERNLARAKPREAKQLETLLMKWLDSFDSTFAVDPAPEDRGELFENLRGMGYL